MSGRSFKEWVAVNEDASDSTQSNPQQIRPPNAPARNAGVATQVVPRFELLLPGEPIAIDIEFQNFLKNGIAWTHRLAWIAALNTKGEIVLDVFVRYPYEKDLRVNLPSAPGKDFGVDWDRLAFKNGAVEAETVEGWCEELFRNRPVVLHGGQHDLTAFQFCDPYRGATVVHDTQVEWRYDPKVPDWAKAKPGLKTLSEEVLHRVIQEGGVHSPVEDADATMVLHLMKRPYDREAEAKKWKPVWESRRAQRGSRPRGGFNQGNNDILGMRGVHTVRGGRGGTQQIQNGGRNNQVLNVNGNVTSTYVEVQNYFPPLPTSGGGTSSGSTRGHGGSTSLGGVWGRGGGQGTGRRGLFGRGRGNLGEW